MEAKFEISLAENIRRKIQSRLEDIAYLNTIKGKACDAR